MPKCKKCGGSGDMFRMSKGSIDVIVPFRDIKAHKEEGYVLKGDLCCSMCNGFGVTDI